MKIWVYKSGLVDLEAPIQMKEDQREKFVEFFKKMFPNDIEVHYREEKTKKFGTKEVEQKKWIIDEYALLLTPNDNSNLAARMGRTEMSVRMQRGHFVSDFLVWLKKKGYSLPVDKTLIKEYMEEKEAKT